MYMNIYTMTDVCKAALLPKNHSSDDGFNVKHGFRAEASLPLAQTTTEVTHDTARLSWIVVTRWDHHIKLMQLQPYLGSFLCISSLMDRVQDLSRMRRLSL